MAKKDDAEVILEDEGTVTIDVSDLTVLAEEAKKAAEGGDADEEIEVDPEPKKPIERKRLNEQRTVETPAVDEATQALTAAKEESERKLKAAEATAASERARRAEAERIASNATKDAEDARATTQETQLTLLESGIESAKNEVASYEGQLAGAYEAGDFKLVASIQTKLSTAAAKVDRLEATKSDFEARKPATTEGRVTTPSQQSEAERYLSQMAPAAQTWLREHPECMPSQLGGDLTANNKMMAGHYAAQSQNVAANTPEYFRIIEEHTGHRQPMSAASTTKAATQEAEEPAPKPKPRAQPSAPPSREPLTAQGRPSGKVSVTLSKDEQEMARVSFPQKTAQEAYAMYARNKIELQAEGKLGRTTH